MEFHTEREEALYTTLKQVLQTTSAITASAITRPSQPVSRYSAMCSMS